jgi:O-methyltransferase involved in polyketide biosynthesis
MTDQQAEALSGVAWTAVQMAQERAAESARADRIFDDPWARRIVDSVIRGSGATPPAWLAEGKTLGDLAAGMAGYIADSWASSSALMSAAVPR